jgi:hypothetical protein
VVLTNQDRYFRRWAQQFVRHDVDNRDMSVLRNIPSGGQAAARGNIEGLYGPAIQRAGRGGTLIISVGHGGTAGPQCDGEMCTVAGDPRNGMVDLLPSEALRIQRAHVFYPRAQQEHDREAVARAEELGRRGCQTAARRYALLVRRRDPAMPISLQSDAIACGNAPAARERLEIRTAYDRIGQMLRDAGVSHVVFLTCRIGNAEDFLDRIACDWGVSITAYRRRVAANPDAEGLIRVYLHPDAEGQGTNTLRAREEIPNRDQYVATGRACQTAVP